MRLKRTWNGRPDDWAVVTGGGSGIGLAIAERLASMGYNILIVSIDSGLEKIAAEIGGRFGMEAVGLEMNLAAADSAAALYDWCCERGIEPAILVNNAGMFIYNDMSSTDAGRTETIINLHILTTSQLSRLFTAGMVKRGRGYILNMSSYSAWMPWPGLALYSATKCYIRNFSRSLAAELRGTGVVSTVVLPAGVTTGLYGLPENLQRIGRRLGILITPERTAETAIAAMFRGRKQCIPGLPMRLALPLVALLPDWIIRLARRKTLRFQK